MNYITIVFLFISILYAVSSPCLLNIEGSMMDTLIDLQSRIEPKDIEPIDPNQDSIPELIAKDLRDKTPEQIKQYPLKDYQAEDIIEALNLLSLSDLDKTIKSISIDDLREIFVNIIIYHR